MGNSSTSMRSRKGNRRHGSSENSPLVGLAIIVASRCGLWCPLLLFELDSEQPWELTASIDRF